MTTTCQHNDSETLEDVILHVQHLTCYPRSSARLSTKVPCRACAVSKRFWTVCSSKSGVQAPHSATARLMRSASTLSARASPSIKTRKHECDCSRQHLRRHFEGPSTLSKHLLDTAVCINCLTTRKFDPLVRHRPSAPLRSDSRIAFHLPLRIPARSGRKTTSRLTQIAFPAYVNPDLCRV